jgi:exodeoxyribonuclease V alpha subunit
MEYTLEQQNGIALLSDLSVKIACLTGPAGTGKTTILRAAVDELSEKLWAKHGGYNCEAEPPFEIALAAFTGRAAVRIEEATDIPAMTIHRMLRFSVPEGDEDFGKPAHSKQNPMPYDVVLIDEATMVDNELYRHVVDAMKPGSVLRLIGDVNQLPPVTQAKVGEPICPFGFAMTKYPTVYLTENFRSTDGIIAFSQLVINHRPLLANEQVTIIKTNAADASAAKYKLCHNFDFTSDEHQIICPTTKTKYGCMGFNNLIQQERNPEKEKISVSQRNKFTDEIETHTFKRGDKMIWTKNDYTMEIMNGQMGRVVDFDTISGDIVISINGQEKMIPQRAMAYDPITREHYPYDPRQRMMLGYAITTHKSQGSQFPHVAYVIARSQAANRANIYTAVTRAQRRLTILNINSALNGAMMMVTKMDAIQQARR